MVDKIPGIYAKIAAVQDEIGAVPKNGRGPSSKGSFEYVKFDDVILGVRDLFVKHSIIVSVETIDHVVNSNIVGSRSVVNTSVKVRYTYTDIADGSSVATVVGGEGSDIGGDTATRKAYTQALKIALLHTFSIYTGDEPDSDGAAPAEIPVPKAEAAIDPDSVQGLQQKVRDIIADKENYPAYDSGAVVNALGNELTKKSPAQWMANKTDLKKVLDAIEKGQLPSA
jgi:hypothetical protein